MWRRLGHSVGNNAQENQDSDQSISEDEGLEGVWTEKTISLSGAADKTKGGMQVLSQLGILRDCYEPHPAKNVSISSHERKIGFCVDDEVENPLFDDEDDSVHYPRITSDYHYNERIISLPTMASISNSDEEFTSDNKRVSPPTLESAREDVSSTWSKASLEVKALVCLHENSGCSSSDGVTMKANKSCKGGVRAKNKPKFSFHIQSCKEDQPLLVGDNNGRTLMANISLPDAIGAKVHKDRYKCMAESQLVVQGNEAELPGNHIVHYELPQRYDFREHSMAESLVCFHERSGLMQGSSETDIERREIRAQIVVDRYTSSMGDGCLDADDLLPDALDSGPSSDDEENHQHLKSIIPRTMADQFHEAFGTVSDNDERPHLAVPRPFSGLFEKLQRVMQSEKERDMDRLKNSSAETSSTEERLCISVRILSKSLEAKLTVCSCTSIGDAENSCLDNLQVKTKSVARTLTIIFSSRMCSDVDLEVGNLIRIYPPWKKVQVIGKDEVIILSSYYSQVQPRDILS